MALRFSRLDRQAIRALRPGKAITEHGITAQRMADGDVRYSVNVMVDGQRIHRTIGTESGGVTRSQAEEFIEQARSDARHGRLALPTGRKLQLTFAKAADLYLGKLREVGGKDITANEQHLRLHLKPYFGSMHLERISDFTLQKFQAHCRSKNMAEATINRVFATYRRMARRIVKWKITSTMLPMVELAKERNARDYVVTIEEEKRLLAAAAFDIEPKLLLFIRIGFGTSLRHSEILSARFDNFDPDRRRLKVWVKGGRWRKQPLPRSIVDLLQQEREAADDKGWVFPRPHSKSGHVENMSKAFARCAKAAGLDPSLVIPHTMRHTAITRCGASTGYSRLGRVG